MHRSKTTLRHRVGKAPTSAGSVSVSFCRASDPRKAQISRPFALKEQIAYVDVFANGCAGFHSVRTHCRLTHILNAF